MKRIKNPSVAAQYVGLKKTFPDSTGTVRRNRLAWTCSIRPTSLSDAYRIRLEYSLEKSPKVFVESPELQERDGERIPHRYLDGSLCLYLPGSGEWDRSMFLFDSIVPWVSEWLIHYELWHATGEWHGGGIHPGDELKVDRE
jgi:hypothetical protein